LKTTHREISPVKATRLPVKSTAHSFEWWLTVNTVALTMFTVLKNQHDCRVKTTTNLLKVLTHHTCNSTSKIGK